MRVAGGAGVARNHDDGANGSVLGDETGSVTAENMLVKGQNLDMVDESTNLVERTRMAPAFCSSEALTAAIAQDSVVGTGMGANLRSSSKALT